MRRVKTILGAALLLFGVIAVLVCVLSMIDPAAAQLTDDASPFGKPRGLGSNLALLFFYLAVTACGYFLIRNGRRSAKGSNLDGVLPK
ncbi:MAG: hypothetical protein ACFUZC_19380 [Chthoniobacteraceae bacterium]